MPEYLSPAVYVEEVSTGSKPIEGVGTSTAAMVGVAERGPVGLPILVTGTGDYGRLFGGLLDLREFGAHAFLPLAADGFFRNGGRRLFVCRVASPTAGAATLTLFDRGTDPAAPESVLVRTATLGQGTGGNPLLVLHAGGLAAGDRIRLGDGSDAEWPTAVGLAAPAAHIALGLPLSDPYPTAGTVVRGYPVSLAGGADLSGTHSLETAAAVGATTLFVQAAAAANRLDRIDPAKHAVRLMTAGAPREVVRVLTAARIGEERLFRLTLARPLGLPHAADAEVQILTADPAAVAGKAITAAVAAGDEVVFTALAAAPGGIVEIANGTRVEMRLAGQPGRIPLLAPAGRVLPRGSMVEHLAPADAAGTPPTLTMDAETGARLIQVGDRSGIQAGTIVRLGPAADPEYATVLALPGVETGTTVAGPGPLALAHGLARAYAAGSMVVLQTVAVTATAAGLLLLPAGPDAPGLLVSHVTAFNVAGTVIRVTAPDGGAYLYRIDGAAVAPVTVRALTLAAPTVGNHPVGATVVERGPLIDVEALDVGGWGDRLRITVEEEANGLVARGSAIGAIGTDRLRLSSLAGVEPGTVLEMRTPEGARIGGLLKVDAVDRAAGTANLAGPMDAAQLAAVGAPGARVAVRSLEFRLGVLLMRRPDPAVPVREETVEAGESFRHLSMDPRHSRYVETVIGRIGGPPRLWDRRPEGESLLIRVSDRDTPVVPGPADPRHATRPGPEPLVDRLPSGTLRAARHPLSGGDDGLAALGSAAIIGVDDREPVNRRGIFSLKNEDDIAIVAAPGLVAVDIQQALINHCEEMRYRFAVLDGPPPRNDSIADVQALRQNYDTRHAALYHPWLTIPDPQPANPAAVVQVAIPPSGHVMGIYARTDIERGVHKAPANEVVRGGVAGLRRALNKAEHDLLNPFPTNINVIRDFRPENRAIRVWGARVLTSDPDFKYVPVRRLLLFIEKSIERGLNWVVFEPNAEPLWARVRFAIEAFLETVWRNGALEGTTTGEAFFVACDRSTMTQADIDNGRLICAVAVAPVKPAEFVIIRIGLKTAGGEE
ncbi:phage tail sheath C-terminal domain-containing protein [Azospirillum largimobile]